MKNLRIILMILTMTLFSCSKAEDSPQPQQQDEPEIETYDFTTFTFLSNGVETKGKIYLPDSYITNQNLPAIYLIDFKEHGAYVDVKDEFEKVVDGVLRIEGFDALVVTLEEHLDIYSDPENFQEYYDIFKNMTSYVDSIYTNSTSRTFIGRGYEAGTVMMTLFLEDSESSVFDNFIATDSGPKFTDAVINIIDTDNFPKNKSNKKLHFSFSDSNNFDNCTSLINKINEKEYSWLQFESIKYDGDFSTMYRTAYADGLKFVFEE